MTFLHKIIPIIETLVGETAKMIPAEKIPLFQKKGLGYSQFNEVLLLLGFDKIPDYLFQYLVDGDIYYKPGASLKNLNHLEEGVNRFVKLALLYYGNIKFAFKRLSDIEEEFEEKVLVSTPFNIKLFTSRHQPIQKILPIPANKTYMLGVFYEAKYNNRVEKNPEDIEAKQWLNDRIPYVQMGQANHIGYLSSDHLDIYVATSMRHEHEYILVNELAEKVFNHNSLKALKLRWFDPTQAYCKNRIDKGIAEGLMLKRASCTLFLVQESDTFGKDSELATTLAQGKPVIAFVPEGNKEYVEELLSNLRELHPNKSEKEIILEQLEIFNSELAWNNPKVISWITRKDEIDLTELKEFFEKTVKNCYNSRADKLMYQHPLGIQVNLKSGVANGVLVVRNVNNCARLIRSIVLNQMDFDIDRDKSCGNEYLFLREKISKCIFRVKTGDMMLTNTFWNYYLDSTPLQ